MCDVPTFAGMRVLLVWMVVTNDGWDMTPGSGIARIRTVYFQIFRRCKNCPILFANEIEKFTK